MTRSRQIRPGGRGGGFFSIRRPRRWGAHDDREHGGSAQDDVGGGTGEQLRRGVGARAVAQGSGKKSSGKSICVLRPSRRKTYAVMTLDGASPAVVKQALIGAFGDMIQGQLRDH